MVQPLPAGLELDGITYRQVDHWVSRGWLRPEDAKAGSGRRRHWSNDERRIAQWMAKLIAIGFTPAAAAPIARGIISDGELSVELVEGIWLEVEEENY